MRERGGGAIGSERFVWLGAAALAGLRMLVLYGQELRNEGRMPVNGLTVGRTRRRSKRDERATFTVGLPAVRLGLAVNRIRVLPG